MEVNEMVGALVIELQGEKNTRENLREKVNRLTGQGNECDAKG